MSKEMQIIEIQNVHGYVDSNGTVWLNLEDIARGLGFTRIAKSGNEVVRWERIKSYLESLNFVPKCGYDCKTNIFIPENIFYRLAMKADNKVARKFQTKVADEILPSIRKHGVYATDNFIERSIADPDWAIAILTELKKTRAERDELKDTVNVQKTQIAELQPKSDYCDIVLKCSSLVSVSVIAKDYGYSAVAFNQLLYNYGIQYKQGDIWLPYQEYAKLGWTKTKTYVYDEENNKCNTHMYWTQKGRLGLYQFLKEKGILPLIEQKGE